MAPLTYKQKLYEICTYFLRLGLLGFGGPFAVIAALQKDLVDTRKWVTEKQFLQSLALIKAMPGPISTQLSIHIAQLRAGKFAGMLAGICLMTPAFIMMLILGYLYQHFMISSSKWPLLGIFLFGMQAAAFGVIAESVLKLTRPYQSKMTFWLFTVLAALLTLRLPSAEPLIILGLGFLNLLYAQNRLFGFAFFPLLTLTKASNLFLVFFKAGALIFGSGLAIVPVVKHAVVDQMHWLSHAQFMDALAFGQITPGPVVITATFIGFHVAGFVGAVIATFAIFLPSFFNILTWFPFLEKKVANSKKIKIFIEGALAGVVGSIVITLIRLGIQPLENTPLFNAYSFWVFVFFSFLLTLKTKAPVWLIIPGIGILTLVLGIINA